MRFKVIENWSINGKILWDKDYYINGIHVWRQFPNNQCVLFYKNGKSDWYYPKKYNMKSFKLIK